MGQALLRVERTDERLLDVYGAGARPSRERRCELSSDFTELVTANMHEALTDEQASLRELHTALAKRLADLDKREERLIDLAGEGLPQHKIRERLNKLREDRARLEAEHANSGAALATGVDVLTECLGLLADVRTLCRNASDEARGALNDAIFVRLLIDEDGVHGADLREPFLEVAEAAQAFRGDAVAPGHTGRILGAQIAPKRGGTTRLCALIPTVGVKDPHGWNRRLMAEVGVSWLRTSE